MDTASYYKIVIRNLGNMIYPMNSLEHEEVFGRFIDSVLSTRFAFMGSTLSIPAETRERITYVYPYNTYMPVCMYNYSSYEIGYL